MSKEDKETAQNIERIADALDRIAPRNIAPELLSEVDAFVWHTDPDRLDPIRRVNRVDISLLCGVDRVRDILLENTRRFAQGLPANNALLWGARGMGKSSLVKAAHAQVNLDLDPKSPSLALIEIAREDIDSLPRLMKILQSSAPRPCLVYCDDLSFDHDDTSFKALKAVLDGGIEGRPENVCFYATSNRRHLMPRQMIENERSTAINPAEAVEEKVSLSDRFGLWLGFHSCSQEDYLNMINGYVDYFQLNVDPERLRAQAIEWQATRGSRSGRVAWQFIQNLAGELGEKLIHR